MPLPSSLRKQALLLLAASVLCGCSVRHGFLSGPGAPQTIVLTGSVHGGSQPVSGSTVQLYAASANGYGGASIALLTQAGLSDSNGHYTLTGNYTCPTASTQVYITATGGNPGLSAGTNNSGLALMANLGDCGNLTPNTTIELNELTTVAAVWPLAQFMSGPASVGTSSTNNLGLRNAFLNSAKLVNTATGAVVASDPENATPVQTLVPGQKLDTLADILSTCVSSDGSTAANAPCGLLFSAATPPGAAAPSDTITAALRIALNPTLQVAALYNLTPVNPPFQPTLTAAPVDWLLGLVYVHNERYGGDTALDGLGNYWVDGFDYDTETPFLVGFGQDPQVLHNGSGLIAIDQNQNIWLATGATSSSPSTLSIVSPADSTMPCESACGPFSGGGLLNPISIAIDAHGNVWTRNSNGTLSEFSSNGAAISPASGYGGLGISGPPPLGVSSGTGFAFDPAGSLWVSNGPDNTVVKVTPALTAGGSPSAVTFRSGAFNATSTLAVDHTGAVWIGNGNNTLTKLDSDGSVAISAVAVGNDCLLSELAIDGSGTVFTAGGGNEPGGVCKIASDGRVLAQGSFPPYGLGDAQAASPAIDASGSLWEENGSFNNTIVTQYVGAATPTGASLATALTNNTLATRP